MTVNLVLKEPNECFFYEKLSKHLVVFQNMFFFQKADLKTNLVVKYLLFKSLKCIFINLLKTSETFCDPF